MTQHQPMVNRVAHIANLDLVAVAAEKLLSRVDGLPGIGVMYGEAGRGKTIACSALANQTRGYYVQMRSAWNRKALLEKILFEMGIKPAGTIPNLLDQVCEQIAASRRPLIIDEFDFCLRSDGLIELVRDIYEGSQGTLLLVGEETIPQKLKRWERFHSRVMAWIPALPVSLVDAELLAPIYCPSVSIAEDLLARLVEVAHGSVRRVCVNLTRVHEEAMMLAESEMTLAKWGERDLYTGDAPKRRGGL
ncbi:ATP-binding protein [Chromobacterium sp. S0633]|uniref:AAA family ATPase n=1 Tax=Chromobacterium sp. S0633 TaxID=2957805 RepID=UPI0020A1A060|nr:ATP-binding protein [Chromobacterium sp. S0633]MCP1290706.1 ATP-binding protein [Chromobacterium sp. S0633]